MKTAQQLAAMSDEELLAELLLVQLMPTSVEVQVHFDNVKSRILDRMDKMRHYHEK